MKIYYENQTTDYFGCRDSRFTTLPLSCTSHLHYHIELAFLMEGETLAVVDSQEYRMTAGDVLLAFPNQIHRFESLKREKYVLLLVSPEIIPELLGQFTEALPASNVIAGAANDPELQDLVYRISDIYHTKESFRETLLRGYLLVFFCRLLKKMELLDTKRGDHQVLDSILNYCTLHFEKNLSLEMLERELHVSKYYISHVMNQKLHIGFNDYVNSLRVSAACKLLVKSDLSVTQISESVGFNTLRTFNRAFLKQMGMTPSEYRAQKKKEGVLVLPHKGEREE
ncbi:MAG: AraC family transcriptional regulator [Clostridia bacterium]|nr:AraC family transcriptional regulator [Clostridia bacterium]